MDYNNVYKLTKMEPEMNEIMTNKQKDILNLLETKYQGCQYELIDKDKVKIIDLNEEEKIFTIDLDGKLTEI